MPGLAARSCRWLTLLALGAGACVDGSYSARSHYPSPEREPEPQHAATASILSAHVVRYGDELRDPDSERLLDGGELRQDRVLLVFAEQLDPLTLDPRAFGILRADGRRVRPTRAFLAPADEGDENRSVTLLGNFGSEAAPPVAVHVIGSLYTESGAELRGLDAPISPASEPDRVVWIEALEPDESRCPGAAQLLRSYWTDSLTHVGADDLANIDLHLGDGRIVHPIDFDDQAHRQDDPPCTEQAGACLGPIDDNVLDLCLDTPAPIVKVHFKAGLFRDRAGQPTAGVLYLLSAGTP